MLLNKQMSKSYMAHYAISSRILLVKLHSEPFNLTLIQVYAPTSTSTVEDIDELYDDLEVEYKHWKSQDMIIIMGDLNAKVGKEEDSLNVTVGPHSIGERNERGDYIPSFIHISLKNSVLFYFMVRHYPVYRI